MAQRTLVLGLGGTRRKDPRRCNRFDSDATPPKSQSLSSRRESHAPLGCAGGRPDTHRSLGEPGRVSVAATFRRAAIPMAAMPRDGTSQPPRTCFARGRRGGIPRSPFDSGSRLSILRSVQTLRPLGSQTPHGPMRSRRRTLARTPPLMPLGTILLLVLLLLLIGALPTWPHSRSWGYYPSGGLGLVLVIVLILVLLGHI